MSFMRTAALGSLVQHAAAVAHEALYAISELRHGTKTK